MNNKNKKIQESKIDLQDEIIRASRLVNLSYNAQNQGALVNQGERIYLPNRENERLEIFKYFLNEDILAVFGKEMFDPGEVKEREPHEGEDPTKKVFEVVRQAEIEITRIQDGLFISTIFGKCYRIKFCSNGLTCYEVTPEDGKISQINNVKEVFCITLGPDVYSNNLIGKVEERDYEYSYEVNNLDSTFKYRCGEKDKQPDFAASLSGLNAKFNSKEALHYMRQIPPVERTRNPFKKIYDTFTKDKFERGEGIIGIVTSEHLTELPNYAREIFDVLKEQAQREIKRTNYGKYLGMKNEEN